MYPCPVGDLGQGHGGHAVLRRDRARRVDQGPGALLLALGRPGPLERLR